MGAPYALYWGKAGRRAEAKFHPLACHGLDAAALALGLLHQDPLLAQRFQALTGLPVSALEAMLPFLTGMHDLGKFSPRFQALRSDLFQALHGRQCLRGYLPHANMGANALDEIIAPSWRDKGWFGLDLAGGDAWDRRDFLTTWLAPVAGHHGQPVTRLDKSLATLFEKSDQIALHEYARDLARLLGAGEPLLQGWDLPTALDGLRRSAWLLAGLIVLCDWLASNEGFFPYHGPVSSLEAYWPLAQARARATLRETGLLPAHIRAFSGLTDLFPYLKPPRPLQIHAASTELPTGPALFILEDATGSGKTEAALALAQRLMARGETQGIFLALPTMATANAMYGRIEKMYPRLFRPEARPSLVLAHSQKRLKDGLEALAGPPRGDQADGDDSRQQCAAWLSDSNKKSLLATVGVGTLDQALLAALPVKHQGLRLLGLGRSLLIADEVHAYDPYTTELLAALLRLLASLGGSAILLSATLPLTTRRRLIQAFREGLGQPGGQEPASLAYPLSTTLHATGLREEPVPLAPGSSRQVRVSLSDDPEAIMERLARAVEAGACACWIRNTVDQARQAHDQLAGRLGAERVELFHARFAMCDRLAIEDRVLTRFGPHSRPRDRAGRLLVATQVVEQSLDLDFDLLASDLAPMDLMIQRAGRLHRHQRSDRPLSTPELLVLSPEPIPDAPRDWYSSLLGRAAYVYRHPGQLWLTASRLAAWPCLRLPEQARQLVEGVYGDEAQDGIPPALADVEEVEEGRESAQRSLARLHGLRPEMGYGELGQVPWGEDTPTRLGPPSVVLRLARWQDGVLTPWAEGHGMRAWELSQARVRLSLVAKEDPAPESALAAAMAQAKAAMADQCGHAVLVPLEPDGEGAWQGRGLNARQEPVKIKYHQATGVDVY